ncbi:MAG: putative acetyltransferase [Gemmataceae bacterium]|nr:putative acetyltransferase [Gemmataceae bacterium]
MQKYTYYKRYRMELDLHRPPPGIVEPGRPEIRTADLPAGFYWVPWHDSLLAAHAEVKALSFQEELDAVVFPCLGSLAGCLELMAAIRGRPGFCPRATWLVASSVVPAHEAAGVAGGCVATIQGVIDDSGFGGIQNVGVVSEYRGRGLGRALMLKALAGFAAAGATRAYLEVTARNEPAVRMYRDLGFRCYKTVYRAVETPEPVAAGL